MSSSSTSGSCAPGYRQDDVYLTIPNACDLNEKAFVTVLALWFAIWLLLLLETLIARFVRKVDRAPPLVEGLYIAWVVITTINVGYILFLQPSVSNFVQGFVLWILFTMGILSNTALLVSLIVHVASANVATKLVSTDRTQLEHLINVSARVLLVFFLCISLVEIVLFIVLPQVYFHDAIKSNMFIQSGYITFAFFILFEVAMAVVLVLRLRRIVGKRLKFRQSQASSGGEGELVTKSLTVMDKRLKYLLMISVNFGTSAFVLWIVVSFVLHGLRWWMYLVIIGPILFGVAFGKMMIFRPNILAVLSLCGLGFSLLDPSLGSSSSAPVSADQKRTSISGPASLSNTTKNNEEEEA